MVQWTNILVDTGIGDEFLWSFKGCTRMNRLHSEDIRKEMKICNRPIQDRITKNKRDWLFIWTGCPMVGYPKQFANTSLLLLKWMYSFWTERGDSPIPWWKKETGKENVWRQWTEALEEIGWNLENRTQNKPTSWRTRAGQELNTTEYMNRVK